MDNSKRDKILNILGENKVVILFVILCIGGIAASGNPLTFVASEVFTRIGRNGFTVLALLIPVLAGMGLNFGITIGAVAAQIAMFWVIYWGFSGIQGFLLALLMATPIAFIFGWLVGKLFNSMKGSEMIAGMVLGYFADGLYQLFFLFIIGGVIPVSNDRLIIPGGIGVKNTIDLTGNLKYALDTVSMLTVIEIMFFVVLAVGIFRIIFNKVKNTGLPLSKDLTIVGLAILVYGLTYVPMIERFLSTDRLLLLDGVTIALVLMVVVQIARIIKFKLIKKDQDYDIKKPIINIILVAILYGLTYIKQIEEVLMYVHIPVTTYLCLVALCMFNNMLVKTRIGQK